MSARATTVHRPGHRLPWAEDPSDPTTFGPGRGRPPGPCRQPVAMSRPKRRRAEVPQLDRRAFVVDPTVRGR